MNFNFQRQIVRETIPLPVHNIEQEIESSNSSLKKIGDVAYAVLSYMPVAGTFIGIHHAYKAIRNDEPTDNWEIAKIMTELFSFLIVPQVIYAIALRFAFEDEVQQFLNELPDHSSNPVDEYNF